MSDLRVTVVPVGRLEVTELEAAVTKVGKVLNRPIELRQSASVPRGSEDSARGQHDAAAMLRALRAGLSALGVAKLVGGAPAVPGRSLVPTPDPHAVVFITDVDLFTAATPAVFGDVDARNRTAVVSVRRLREAFYRRKADPAKQRARVVKVVLQAIGRLCGLVDCRDPRCAMAPTGALADIDMKDERFCAPCHKRLTQGIVAR